MEKLDESMAEYNFGKHKGKEWSELPIDYVEWVASKSNVDWQRDEGSWFTNLMGALGGGL